MHQNSRWEYGSDFHWISPELTPQIGFTIPDAGYFSTGRDALAWYCINKLGQHGTVYLPAYYCEDVIVKLENLLPNRIELFFDHPLIHDDRDSLNQLSLVDGDIIVRVDYFGLRPLKTWESAQNLSIIEDITHRPSRLINRGGLSTCFASLRKTFPIPDGGVLVPFALPPVPYDESHNWVVDMRIDAMQKKISYLTTGYPEKSEWRKLFFDSEQTISPSYPTRISDTSMSLLQVMPAKDILNKKNQLLTRLYAHVNPSYRLKSLEKTDEPFSLILLCESKPEKEYIRQELIKHNIYPAVLWPMSDEYRKRAGNEASVFSDKMISIPADFRYSHGDVDIVLEILSGVLQ